jgi:fatty-acyl-CoA synthase
VSLDASGYVGDWMGRAATYWPERLAVVDPGPTGGPPAAAAAGRPEAGAAGPLAAAAAGRPEAGGGGRFTYADMDGRAWRLAGWLRRAGVGRGDRVGVLARNRVEFLDAFFACGKLGAVLAPWNWRLHPAELAELAARTRPAVLLYDAEFEPGAAAIAAAVAPRLLHLDGEGLAGSRPYGEAMAAAPLAAAEPGLSEEDTACLLFTGGTTGVAKAARVSYRMMQKPQGTATTGADRPSSPYAPTDSPALAPPGSQVDDTDHDGSVGLWERPKPTRSTRTRTTRPAQLGREASR